MILRAESPVWLPLLLLIGAVFAAAPARGSLIAFASDLSQNSTHWATDVTNRGGTIVSDLDFEAVALHPTTATLADANATYSYLGVTLSESGSVGNITNGAGPGDVSPGPTLGEGPHAPSHYLYSGLGVTHPGGTFSIAFDQNVLGAGLFAIDYFNPAGDNPLTLEAFDQNGISLGSATSISVNVQPNGMYFLGLVSTNADIRKITLTIAGAHSDSIGLDNVVFATPMVPVPEPSSLALLGLGMFGAAGFGLRHRRKRIAKL